MSVYSKNLQGVNQRVFVGAADVEYSAISTFAAFVDSSAEGELGIFLEAGTLKTDALAAGARFYIAQKRDGLIHKTPVIAWDDLKRKVKTAYTAPVNQVSYIGYATTGSDDINFDFSLASVNNTLTFGIAVSETTPGNQPFPIQEGYATVNATTADEYNTLATIVSQLNGDFDYQREQPDRFVKAEIVADGALSAFGQTLAVVNGSVNATAGANVTFAAGTKISAAGTIYKLATAVTAGTAIVFDRPYQGTSATLASGTSSSTAATMAYTSGTTKLGVKFTTLSTDSHFKVRTIGDLYSLAPVITYTTPWKQGSGSYAMTLAAEKEARFFDGVGSTLNASFPDDYGQPTMFSSSSKTYDLYILDFAPSIFPSAGLPNYDQKQIERLYIAAQSSGTGITGEMATIFGL